MAASIWCRHRLLIYAASAWPTVPGLPYALLPCGCTWQIKLCAIKNQNELPNTCSSFHWVMPEREREGGRVRERDREGTVTKASCSYRALKLIKSRLPAGKSTASAATACLVHFRHSSSSHCASWAHPCRPPHRCPLFMLLLVLLLLLLLSSCGAFSSRLAGFGFPVGTHTDKARNTCLAVKAN